MTARRTISSACLPGTSRPVGMPSSSLNNGMIDVCASRNPHLTNEDMTYLHPTNYVSVRTPLCGCRFPRSAVNVDDMMYRALANWALGCHRPPSALALTEPIREQPIIWVSGIGIADWNTSKADRGRTCGKEIGRVLLHVSPSDTTYRPRGHRQARSLSAFGRAECRAGALIPGRMRRINGGRKGFSAAMDGALAEREIEDAVEQLAYRMESARKGDSLCTTQGPRTQLRERAGAAVDWQTAVVRSRGECEAR